MEKIRTCTCGALFVPNGRGQIRCEECHKGARRARPFKCDIIETAPNLHCQGKELTSPFYGRCLGYMRGVCEKCLDYCEANNWKGWKAESYEWWSGVHTLGPDE